MNTYLVKWYAWLCICMLVFSISSNAQITDTLQQGDKAPLLVMDDVFGNKVSFKKILKEEKILLVMLRHAWCPVCNVRVHELIQQYDVVKSKGYEVIAVFSSRQPILREYAEDYDLPFVVIADYELESYVAYKMEFSRKKVVSDFSKHPVTTKMKAKGNKLFKQNKTTSTYKDKKENGLDLVPGDFIINQKGEIEQAYYGQFFGDHLPLGEL